MQKIASPSELQAELKAVMAFVRASEKPDRQVVASKLNELADRLSSDPKLSTDITRAAKKAGQIAADAVEKHLKQRERHTLGAHPKNKIVVAVTDIVWDELGGGQ